TGFAVTNTYERIITAGSPAIPQTVTPQKGQVYGLQSLGHNTTNSIMMGLVSERVSGNGIETGTVLDCTFIGCTSENNGGSSTGLQVNSETQMTTFIGWDLESNGTDLILSGTQNGNEFINCLSTGTVLVHGGYKTRFRNGQYNTITIDSNTAI